MSEVVLVVLFVVIVGQKNRTCHYNTLKAGNCGPKSESLSGNSRLTIRKTETNSHATQAEQFNLMFHAIDNRNE